MSVRVRIPSPALRKNNIMSKRGTCFGCRNTLYGYRNWCNKCMRYFIDIYIMKMVNKGWTLIVDDKGIRRLI